jgi:hypothetical protein
MKENLQILFFPELIRAEGALIHRYAMLCAPAEG